MYTKDEFEEASYVPEDYDMKCEEFWIYVAEKLTVFKGRIRKIFRELLTDNSREALLSLSEGEEHEHSVLLSLLEDGAEPERTEDPILIAETEAWICMMRGSRIEILSELHGQSLAEQNRYVTGRIDESLLDEEIGLLLMDSRRRLELPKDIRAIRVCPFDPADYLTSTVVKARLKSRDAKTTS